MSEIQIIPSEDLELIHQLGKECFIATYANIISKEQMEYMLEMMYAVENLRRQIQEEGHEYFIAYQDDYPIGFVSIERQGENLFHLQKIYLRESHQGKGLGRVLIEFAFEYVAQISSGESIMELNVNRGNTRAIEFYKRMGMYCDRSGDFAIGGDFYMNDYIMAIKL